MTSPGGGWLPSGTVTKSVNVNGFWYVGGNVEKLNGTPVIYGSLYIKGSFAPNGNVTAYYRSDFDYGLIVSGTMGMSEWREIDASAMPAPLPVN